MVRKKKKYYHAKAAPYFSYIINIHHMLTLPYAEHTNTLKTSECRSTAIYQLWALQTSSCCTGKQTVKCPSFLARAFHPSHKTHGCPCKSCP